MLSESKTKGRARQTRSSGKAIRFTVVPSVARILTALVPMGVSGGPPRMAEPGFDEAHAARAIIASTRGPVIVPPGLGVASTLQNPFTAKAVERSPGGLNARTVIGPLALRAHSATGGADARRPAIPHERPRGHQKCRCGRIGARLSSPGRGSRSGKY